MSHFLRSASQLKSSSPVKRFWLACATTVAISAGFLFFPQIDIWFSSLFYSERGFVLATSPRLQAFRSLNDWMGGAILLWSLIVLLNVDLRERLKIELWRAFTPFIAYGLGVGIIVNGILKDGFGRSRPRDLLEFGGADAFTRVWEFSTQCSSNCSFTSGEAAGAAAMFSVLAVVPPLRHWRLPVVAVMALVTALLGLNRIAFGAHFLSDVLLSFAIVIAVILAMECCSPERITRVFTLYANRDVSR